MEELERLELERKITDIVFSWKKWYDCRNVGFTTALHPSIFFLNLGHRLIYSPKFWQENFVAIITHETLHDVLAKRISEKVSLALDNLFGYLPRNNFFVDGDWKWIKKRGK